MFSGSIGKDQSGLPLKFKLEIPCYSKLFYRKNNFLQVSDGKFLALGTTTSRSSLYINVPG